ncbi:MAG: YaiI/YqxD family protein, partial [Halieaceae bacterium]|nr:YaiI/YqxD family protein [Halieaceae bacterium]
KQRLQMRDFMETMRASGQNTGGPPPMSQTDRKTFADQLDKLLTQRSRQ